jgi:hypothetical protein
MPQFAQKSGSWVHWPLLSLIGGFALAAVGCGNEPSPWDPFGYYEIDAGIEAAPPPVVPTGEWPIGGSPGAEIPPVAGSEAPPPAAGGEPPAPGGAPAVPPVVEPPSTFRITELFLRDPHMYVGMSDVTDAPVLGNSINRNTIPAQLTMDKNGDGQFDASTLLIVQPFDPRVPAGTLRVLDGRCPINGGPCQTGDSAALDANWQLENRLQGSCLAPIEGTTNNRITTVPIAPCFVTSTAADLTLLMGGTKVPVVAVKIGATYQANPKQLLNGLLYGFVTDAAAMKATLPAEAGAAASGMPLSNFIRSQDKDTADSPNGMAGFWIYFNFVAKPVDFPQ